MPHRAAELTVAIVALPGAIGLDVGIPVHILGSQDGYRVRVCAEAAEAIEGVGFGITPTHSLADVPDADIVVVPGYAEPERPLPAAYLDALRAAADRGARVVAICTGTFAVAACGLLDGRDAATHWRYTDRLRERHPLVNVLENRLFVEDGKVLTTAGGGAAIDACLHLIRSDFGAAAAHRAGMGVVAAPARGGDQPQYVDVPTPSRSDLSATRAWVMANIGEPITVRRMAEHSDLPRRTFIRRFDHETGMPPMRWVALQRVLGARRLLEESDWSVERIAAATGFGTAANFRAVFRREVGTTPGAYRKAHLGARPPADADRA
ncbi:GlxA family transcriptional regulator [Saccharothrix australiensis]|uniref:AraC family transcriptional regulator with amidase-like domain n=1 Tax=Saccharothrix australiensis TaxID=2072 RepID=A0A495W0F3_9PSEU|nr:helix-turn-helix domain-containing protein [Saccharothrix australiensis]RKT55162.1 AraC family transcriptional regulator with amidase-like domain [Saccharothrix australiensis]